jgi:putative DNA primase/helicase
MKNTQSNKSETPKSDAMPSPIINIKNSKVAGNPIDHKEILNELLKEVSPLNFILLIRPEAKEIYDEQKTINDALASNDVEAHEKLNQSKDGKEKSRQDELTAKLKAIIKSIKQKHYVVCIISELLELAKKSKWNLCKCYDYVYVFNGAYWKQLSKEDLKYFLGEAAIKFGYSEIDAVHHLFKDELLKQFLTQAHLPEPEYNNEKVFINLKNGTFDFTGGNLKLCAFNPKDFITYQLPFSYDESAACPLFNAYLEKVLPDASCRSILQEFSGFIFTKMNLEKCLVLTGGGSNGKSVFFNILTTLLGRENTLAYSMGLFDSEYNRARLTNVLVNYSSEKGRDLNVDIFKALVTGEPVQAREPYGKPFSLTSKVKFIINCNELPKETESTEAYFRRYLIIPFDVRINESERDINLAQKIINDELPGVFNWILEGLKRLIHQKKFSESEKVNNALDEFKKQSDSVALFIDEKKYQRSSDTKMELSILYNLYKPFCLEDRYKPLGKNKFSQRLVSKGFELCRTNDGQTAFFMA